MGCRIACFGWRGLKTLLTSMFWSKILSLRTLNGSATWDLEWRREGLSMAASGTLNYMHCNAIRGPFALPFEVPPNAI